MNIYQVINEKDLSEIITESHNRLIIVMFTNYSSFDKTLSYKLKKAFFDISKAYIYNTFIYIDLNSFDGEPEKFTEDLKIPRFCFFFNSQSLGNVQGLNLNIFVQQLNFVNSKLEDLKNINNENSENNGDTVDNNTKNSNTYNQNSTNNKQHKINYEDQNITPSELKNIINIKKKLEEKGVSSSISELIVSHVVQRDSADKNINNTDNSQINQTGEPIDEEKLEQYKRLQILNATKNQVQMKLCNQIMNLKKLKQRKELEEIKEKQRQEKEKQKQEEEEKRREEDKKRKEKIMEVKKNRSTKK